MTRGLAIIEDAIVAKEREWNNACAGGTELRFLKEFKNSAARKRVMRSGIRADGVLRSR